MKKGINNWFGYVIEPEEKYKMIKSAGFDNILLWWSDEYESQVGKKESLPDKARREGLFIENIHVPFARANSIWEETSDTKDAMGEYINCVKACNRHSIPTMVFHLTYGATPPPFSQTGLDNLKILSEAAEKYGTNIALENVRRPEYIDYVLEKIDSDRLKLCYDTGHEMCFSKTDMLSKFGNRLAALHLHDNFGDKDSHLIPGDGKIDWKEVAGKIKKTGYTGSVTLESANLGHEAYKGMNVGEFLEKSYAAAQKIAGLLEE